MAVLPQIRIKESTKERLQILADGDKRRLTDFIRIKLDEVVEQEILKKTSE